MILALIPAFNEEKTISAVIKDVEKHVDEVVVIDDASKDNTVEIAQQSGATVLVHKINRGQGATLETGHTYARKKNADVVIHFDADGQFDGAEIPKALTEFKTQNVDVLLGSRFLKENTDVPALKRHVLLPLGRLLDRMLGSVRLTDSHNGFRVLGKKALEHIHIEQDRMAHATEIPVLIKKHGLRYAEFPVTVRYSEFGQGATGGLRIVKELLLGKFLK